MLCRFDVLHTMMSFECQKYRKCWTSPRCRPTSSTALGLCFWTNDRSLDLQKGWPTRARRASEAFWTHSASAPLVVRYIQINSKQHSSNTYVHKFVQRRVLFYLCTCQKSGQQGTCSLLLSRQAFSCSCSAGTHEKLICGNVCSWRESRDTGTSPSRYNRGCKEEQTLEHLQTQRTRPPTRRHQGREKSRSCSCHHCPTRAWKALRQWTMKFPRELRTTRDNLQHGRQFMNTCSLHPGATMSFCKQWAPRHHQHVFSWWTCHQGHHHLRVILCALLNGEKELPIGHHLELDDRQAWIWVYMLYHIVPKGMATWRQGLHVNAHLELQRSTSTSTKSPESWIIAKQLSVFVIRVQSSYCRKNTLERCCIMAYIFVRLQCPQTLSVYISAKGGTVTL